MYNVQHYITLNSHGPLMDVFFCGCAIDEIDHLWSLDVQTDDNKTTPELQIWRTFYTSILQILFRVKTNLEEEVLLLLLLRQRMKCRRKRNFRVHLENKNESQFNFFYNSLRMYDENI